MNEYNLVISNFLLYQTSQRHDRNQYKYNSDLFMAWFAALVTACASVLRAPTQASKI